MFRFISNIPIFRRLVIVFAIATIIPILVIVLLGSFYLQSIGVRGQAVQTSFDAQNIATREQANLERMNALLQARFAQVFAQNSPALAKDPSLLASGELTSADVAALEIEFAQSLLSYQQNYEIATSDNMSTIRNILTSDTPDQGRQVIGDQQAALSAVINTDWRAYQQVQDKVLAELEQPKPDYFTTYADLYQANLDFLHLKNHWQQVVDTATEMGTAVTQVGPSLKNPLLIYTGAAVLFTLLAVAAAGFLVNSTIVTPLNRLVALTKRIAQGETRMRADIQGNDEIYQVAKSMNGMLDFIVHLMQEAQSRHADLQAHIEKLIHEVSGAGEGDLRIQAEVESNELGMLASSFNLMAEDLSTLVVNVKTLAHGVQQAILQLFSYVEQLVDRADLQIQHVSRATTEMEHMATSSREVAERAQGLSSIAVQARQIAQGGRNALQQTFEGMERINNNIRATSLKVSTLGDRSREINDIVEAITSIAHQTNRLALDAAIQAAMAGENGKGFGAVAADIRRLAERSREQALLIGQLLRSVLEDIQTAALSIRETEQEAASGTHLTQQVGRALETIFAVVERQASEIEATNQVARQHFQSAVLAAQLMQQVSETAQQNSASTHEVTRQMERLAQLAGQLLTSVEVFKVREDRQQAVSVASIRPTPVRGRQPGNLLGQGAAPVRLLGGERDRPPTMSGPYNGPFGRQQQ
jgi:methyl-accepting chemotaxis protein